MNSRRRGRLHFRLIRAVVVLVSVMFAAFFLLVVRDVFVSTQQREIENMQTQVSKTAQQITYIQQTLQNISKLIVYNDVVQSRITLQDSNAGEKLFAARSVGSTLREYLHILDGVDEITIYTTDGKTLTSRYVRGDLDPEKTDWFRAFLDSGKNSGYTRVHRSIPWQSGYSLDVISYIVNYYAIDRVNEKLGELIISFDFSKLTEIVQMDTTILNGYRLLDGDGETLISEGTLNVTPEELAACVESGVMWRKNGALVASGEMQEGWALVCEISSRALIRRAATSVMEIFFVFLGMLVLAALLLRHFITRIVNPINALSTAVENVGRGDLNVRVAIHTGDEIEDLADAFNKMVGDIDTLLRESVEHEKKLQQIQTENLMLQINPHFIYNTMNSIVYMARMDGNREIADFTNTFISLLQSTLRVRNSIYSTLGEELRIVQYYLLLQEYRYGNKFTYEIRCPEELKDCRILSVMLQPAVENSIFHGIAPKDSPGRLEIEARQENETLVITVTDDGVGISPEQLREIMREDYTQNTGIHKIGIGNVRKRIQEMYGEPYALTLESEQGAWTRVVIRIPMEKKEA